VKFFGFFFNVNLNSLTLREAIFMGHVPWLGSIALSLPGFANNTKIFCAHAKSWARRRIKEGSIHKDLFYHLVRFTSPNLIAKIFLKQNIYIYSRLTKII
jgi:hypothetical protein